MIENIIIHYYFSYNKLNILDVNITKESNS